MDVTAGVATRSRNCPVPGWRPEEAADSKWWLDKFISQDLARVDAIRRDTCRAAPACRHEYRIRHRTGTIVWIGTAIAIVYGTDGKPVSP